jgi:hypothetical protein
MPERSYFDFVHVNASGASLAARSNPTQAAVWRMQSVNSSILAYHDKHSSSNHRISQVIRVEVKGRLVDYDS